MFRCFSLLCLGVTFLNSLVAPALSQETSRAIQQVILQDEVGMEDGLWRIKVQHVFDPRDQNLLTRTYSVFDPLPSRDMSFSWMPRDVKSDRSGRVSGDGQLVWRKRGSSPNDPAANYSVYSGHMKDGKPEGIGRYSNRNNLIYDGSWKDGRFHGRGTLQLPSGETYEGFFAKGKASGLGTFVDITGEIFEGSFSGGLRQGIGTTILPGGLTYRSTWREGNEIPNSKRIRLSQLGASSSLVGNDSIRLGVTVETKPIRDSLPASQSLGYLAKPTSNKMVVRPDDAQLVSVWKDRGTIQEKVIAINTDDSGGYREGLFGFDKNAIFPPKLAFDLQNKSATKIEIKGFYLDVNASNTETQPALDLSSTSDRDTCAQSANVAKVAKRGNFSPYFRLNNYGWSQVEDAVLHFDFTNSSESSTPVQTKYEIRVGSFQKKTNIDVTDTIAQAGGNMILLRKFGRQGFSCERDETSGNARSEPQCIEKLRASGAFGTLSQSISLNGIDVVIGLRGTLEYRYRDATGKLTTTSSPLKIDLIVGGLTQSPECGEGGPLQPIRSNPINLKLDQNSYQIQLPTPISTVDPGHSRQFSLAFVAPKSSHHDFQLVAVLTDGREIRSRPIELLYFLPSWHPDPNY